MKLSALVLSLPVLALTVLGLAPATMHATPITYTFALTDASNSTYSGAGSVTFNTAPTATFTNYAANVTALSFTVDGQTFNKSDAGVSFNTFEFSSLSPLTIFDITFADSVGSSPNRLTLDTTGNYVFYYNDGQSSATGTFGPAVVSTASPTPEPSSLLLLGTGLLGGAGSLLRRMKLQRP